MIRMSALRSLLSAVLPGSPATDRVARCVPGRAAPREALVRTCRLIAVLLTTSLLARPAAAQCNQAFATGEVRIDYRSQWDDCVIFYRYQLTTNAIDPWTGLPWEYSSCCWVVYETRTRPDGAAGGTCTSGASENITVDIGRSPCVGNVCGDSVILPWISSNCCTLLSGRYIDATIKWPPRRTGTAYVRIEPCSGGFNSLVFTTTRHPNAAPDYRVEAQIITTTSNTPANRVGESLTISLPSEGTLSVPMTISNCDAVAGSPRTTRVVTIRGFCGSDAVPETRLRIFYPGSDFCSDYYGAIREKVKAAAAQPRRCRVRSPSAVMGVRGFTDTTTVLQYPRFSTDWAVRWTRTVGEQPGKSGDVEIREVTDGVQPGGSVVSGANTPRLTILNATEQDLGFYTMELIPPPGSEKENDTIAEETIRVMEDVGQPVFTVEPASRTVCASELSYPNNMISIPVTVESSDPNDPIHYRWYVNGRHDQEQVPLQAGSNAHVYRVGEYSSELRLGNGDLTGLTQPRVTLTVRCEAFNSHGLLSSRDAEIVIDLSGNDCDADGVTDACEIAAGAADANANEVPDACECMTDVDGDGMTGASDLSQVLANWGEVVPEALSMFSDFDDDGMVGASDLSQVLANWGPCGAP